MINIEDVLKNVSKDDKLLVKSIIDKYNRYDKTGINICTNFLDMREEKLIKDILNRLKIEYSVYKSISECEKSIIYFGDYDDYISIYKFKIKNITHKDILGTLFSIGLNNDTIGDIFINNNYAYITSLSKLDKYIESNLLIIKNERIELLKVEKIELNPNRFIDLKIVIPSYRLDVIVSKLSHVSREESSRMIKDKLVLVNYEEITSVNKIVSLGDIISIRKVGKFIISRELSKSKKDNYFIEIKKYN